MTQRTQVFLSYSSADAKLARQLALDLQCANLDVWLDQWRLGVGETFEQSLEHGVDSAQFVIVLLSKNSVASTWVEFEWRRKVHHEALTEHRSIIPVRAEICDIPDFLAERSYADIAGGSYPLGFKHLLEIIVHYSNDSSITIPQTTIPEISALKHLEQAVYPIELIVGHQLIALFEPELLTALQGSLQSTFGFAFPTIRVVEGASDMPPMMAQISIEEVPELVIDLEDEKAPLQNAAEYLLGALHYVIGKMASLFLTIDSARLLVDKVKKTDPDLVCDTVPRRVSWIELTDILQRLVTERVSVADITRILQAIKHSPDNLQDTSLLTEAVRHGLSQQISDKVTQGTGLLKVLTLSAEVETLISDSIQSSPTGRYVNLHPQLVQHILAAIRQQLNLYEQRDKQLPIVLTLSPIRRTVANLIQLEFEQVQVLSREDLSPQVSVQVLGEVCLGASL